jgi:hypothetical protein
MSKKAAEPSMLQRMADAWRAEERLWDLQIGEREGSGNAWLAVRLGQPTGAAHPPANERIVRMGRMTRTKAHAAFMVLRDRECARAVAAALSTPTRAMRRAGRDAAPQAATYLAYISAVLGEPTPEENRRVILAYTQAGLYRSLLENVKALNYRRDDVVDDGGQAGHFAGG